MASKSAVSKVLVIALVAVIVVAAIIGVAVYYILGAAPKPKDTIVLGATLSLTGADALGNSYILAAWTYAINETNNAGGLYVKEYGRKLKVELRYILDDRGDTTIGVTNLEQLAEVHNVDFLLGGTPGAGGEDSFKVAERYRKILLIGAHGYHPYFHKDKGYTHVFTFGVGTYTFMDAIFSFFRDNPYLDPPPRVIAIWHDDTTVMHDVVNYIKGKSGDLTVVSEAFPSGTTDFSTAIATAMGASPPIDVLIVWLGEWSSVVSLWRQLQEFKWNLKMFASLKNIAPEQMVKDLGESCYYRYICAQPGSTDEVYAYYVKLQKIFKFKELPVGLSFLAYAGITTLFKAIENAGTLNSDAVAEEMRNVMRRAEVHTFGIPFKYDPEYPNFYQEQPAVAILTPPYRVGELTYYFKLVRFDKWYPENWKWPMEPW